MKQLHPLHTDIAKPERFTYPFCYEPHPLCEMAAKEVQAYIGEHDEIREDADVMLDSTLESEEALKDYAKHPEHLAVANRKVRPYTVQRSCLDFEI